MPFAVRVGTATDIPFVMDAWMQCARESSGHVEGVEFVPWQKADQREILARPSTCLRVAHPTDDPNVILGWVALCETTRPAALYYLFTRFHSRRLGLATLLLGDLLARPDVFYGARLPRVCRKCGRSDCRDCPDPGRWVSHPLTLRIPKSWKYVPRINHREISRAV